MSLRNKHTAFLSMFYEIVLSGISGLYRDLTCDLLLWELLQHH